MSGQSKPVVLVADDEIDMLQVYTSYLNDEYSVLSAGGGEEAIDTFYENIHDIDCVLLDRRMPDMSGDDVLREIKDSPADVPVAMVTAVDPGVDIVDLECEHYETKPVTPEDLLNLVSQLLQISEFTTKQRSLVEKRVKLNAVLENGESHVEHNERVEELRDEIDDLEAQVEEIGNQLPLEGY
jgi:CheY-like chemotaxis protein